jgi:hypothetical protein
MQGSRISKAEILLNGRPVTTSGVDGVYHLENMKTNTYRLQVKVDNIFFDEQEIKITPNTPQLPPIVPSR